MKCIFLRDNIINYLLLSEQKKRKKSSDLPHMGAQENCVVNRKSGVILGKKMDSF